MMQRFIYLCVVFAVSSAVDVSVYDARDLHDAHPRTELELVSESTFPWKFVYNDFNNWLFLTVFYRNESSNVTATALTYGSNLEKFEESIETLSTGENVTVFLHPLSGPEAIINLNLYSSNGLCASVRIAEGRLVSKETPEKPEKEYKYIGVCSKRINQPCVLMLDLKDFVCLYIETYDQQPPPQSNVLISVISSVIGAGVIILVIYLCVKKYRHRHSHLVETMEVNTYNNHLSDDHLIPSRN